jgi:hypothetical protein
MKMKKLFNVAGPCNYNDHYMVPMVERHVEAEELIEQKQYFVIHAPRQTGKTTLVQELVHKLKKEEQYYVLYCSLETVEVFTEPETGIPEIFNNLKFAVRHSNIPQKKLFGIDVDKTEISLLIKSVISDFCIELDKPLVLFIDEIDSLSDRTLVSFIRQLRDGYITRNDIPFPHSIALIGLRNIRDFKSRVRENKDTLGSASPFNIIKKALTIEAFGYEHIEYLYRQHTEETGQVFTKEAIDAVYKRTNGQPWLVNAIANEIVEDILKKDFSKTIQVEMVEQAIQNIILRRDTHIDSLLDKLKEERVRKVIGSVVLGKIGTIDILHEDTQYCLNLGLIRKDKKEGLVPANSIYSEVIIRTLNYNTQFELEREVKNTWFKEDGHLDMDGLLKEFQNFWRLHSGMWTEKYDYKEAAPHLVLNAYLQRVINGGGTIIREYAYGKGRMDLCVIYNKQNYPIEIKLLYDKNTIPEGIEQLSNYMDGLGEKIGWLVVFDRDMNKTWEEKISWNTTQYRNMVIHLVRC